MDLPGKQSVRRRGTARGATVGKETPLPETKKMACKTEIKEEGRRGDYTPGHLRSEQSRHHQDTGFFQKKRRQPPVMLVTRCHKKKVP